MSFIEGIDKTAFRGADVGEGIPPNSGTKYDPRYISGVSTVPPLKESIDKKIPRRGHAGKPRKASDTSDSALNAVIRV